MHLETLPLRRLRLPGFSEPRTPVGGGTPGLSLAVAACFLHAARRLGRWGSALVGLGLLPLALAVVLLWAALIPLLTLLAGGGRRYGCWGRLARVRRPSCGSLSGWGCPTAA